MSTARRVYLVLAVGVAVAVLVQAVLAGRALFGSWSITVHGALGNATFAVAVGVVTAAVVAGASRRAVLVAVVLAVVLMVQIGLGYAGRDGAEAAAWHIPNGVLAFGLAVHQLHLAERAEAAATSTRPSPKGGVGRRSRRRP